MRLSTAVQHFLAEYRNPLTRANYASDLNLLSALATTEGEHGDNVTSFTPRLVSRYFSGVAAQRASQATLHRRRICLALFARWGQRHGHWPTDPMIAAPRTRAPRRLPRPFKRDERERIYALELSPEEHVLRAVLRWTGLRVSEVIAVRIRDVALTSRAEPGALRVIGKGNREDVLPIIPELGEILFDWMTTRTDLRPATPLFTRRDGRPWTDAMVRARCREWGRAAGVERVTPHRFRHSFATELFEAGADPRAVQKLMRHADLNTTMGYTEVADSAAVQAAMLLSRPRKDAGVIGGSYTDHPEDAG